MAKLNKTIKKMLEHENPVELVNNLYGCHPDSLGVDYFDRIFK